MANPIIRGFSNLTRFSGRDRRRQFWPYAGVVAALVYLLAGGLMVAAMAPMMAEMSEYAAANPEHATVVSGPGTYSVSIDADAPGAPGMPDMTIAFGGLGLAMLAAVVLLAAAVSRRLHDTGRTALWGLAPLPFLTFSMVMMPTLMRNFMGDSDPNFGLFGLLFLSNVLYMAALVGLVALLCLGTRPGANRYGEEPA